jgi:hypothetical protein
VPTWGVVNHSSRTYALLNRYRQWREDNINVYQDKIGFVSVKRIQKAPDMVQWPAVQTTYVAGHHPSSSFILNTKFWRLHSVSVFRWNLLSSCIIVTNLYVLFMGIKVRDLRKVGNKTISWATNSFIRTLQYAIDFKSFQSHIRQEVMWCLFRIQTSAG